QTGCLICYHESAPFTGSRHECVDFKKAIDVVCEPAFYRDLAGAPLWHRDLDRSDTYVFLHHAGFALIDLETDIGLSVLGSGKDLSPTRGNDRISLNDRREDSLP